MLPIDVEKARATIFALAARPSYERARAEAMGFKFAPVRVLVEDDTGVGTLRINVDFRCVCGTPERFSERITYEELPYALERPERFDFGARLRQLGSFSRDHLLADGYAPSKVDEIIALGEAFDRSAGRALPTGWDARVFRTSVVWAPPLASAQVMR